MKNSTRAQSGKELDVPEPWQNAIWIDIDTAFRGKLGGLFLVAVVVNDSMAVNQRFLETVWCNFSVILKTDHVGFIVFYGDFYLYLFLCLLFIYVERNYSACSRTFNGWLITQPCFYFCLVLLKVLFYWIETRSLHITERSFLLK